MLTIEHLWVCPSNFDWSKIVNGSKGAQYIVRWNKAPPGHPYEYRWTCTCPNFKFHKEELHDYECKHIRSVKNERCAWNEEAFCGSGEQPPANHKCPKCGEGLEVVRVGV